MSPSHGSLFGAFQEQLLALFYCFHYCCDVCSVLAACDSCVAAFLVVMVLSLVLLLLSRVNDLQYILVEKKIMYLFVWAGLI